MELIELAFDNSYLCVGTTCTPDMTGWYELLPQLQEPSCAEGNFLGTRGDIARRATDIQRNSLRVFARR